MRAASWAKVASGYGRGRPDALVVGFAGAGEVQPEAWAFSWNGSLNRDAGRDTRLFDSNGAHCVSLPHEHDGLMMASARARPGCFGLSIRH